MTEIIALLDLLAWPTAFLVVVILFRRSLTGIADRLLGAKYKDFEVTLAAQDQAIEKLSRGSVMLQNSVKKTAAELEKGQKHDPEVAEKLKEILDSLETIAGLREAQIFEFISESDGKASVASIIMELTENADPWRKHKDEEQVESAIKSLVNLRHLREVTEAGVKYVYLPR